LRCSSAERKSRKKERKKVRKTGSGERISWSQKRVIIFIIIKIFWHAINYADCDEVCGKEERKERQMPCTESEQ
jgi:hypothetical protein